MGQTGKAETGAVAGAVVLGDYVSREDLAAQLHLTSKTLAKWANQRKGPAFVKVGRKVFYRKDAVQAWLRKNESTLLAAGSK